MKLFTLAIVFLIFATPLLSVEPLGVVDPLPTTERPVMREVFKTLGLPDDALDTEDFFQRASNTLSCWKNDDAIRMAVQIAQSMKLNTQAGSIEVINDILDATQQEMSQLERVLSIAQILKNLQEPLTAYVMNKHILNRMINLNALAKLMTELDSSKRLQSGDASFIVENFDCVYRELRQSNRSDMVMVRQIVDSLRSR